jgi:hypothetical protein
MMTLEQRLLTDLHALPPEQQVEVADFAAFLRHRVELARPSESPDIGLQPLPVLKGSMPTGWKDAVYEPE